MFVAEVIQGKGGKRAHEKNVCWGFISDDNFIQKEGELRVRRMGKIGGSSKSPFLFLSFFFCC